MEAPSRLLNERYKLLERAGSGGMATVFKAHDLVLGRAVAIKVLHEGLSSDAGFIARFRQEAQAAAALAHPNIVTVHDVGQAGRLHFIVMEYVEGRTLKQWVQAQKEAGQPMPVRQALDLGVQICAGIGYAHRAGLVHCDVKPQNIIVTRDQRVKVTDFGIARAISEASQEARSEVWGTPQYFAPEQAAGDPPTPASDVYAIGVILFELLTNQLPFRGDSAVAIALQHLHEPAPRPIDLNPAIPPSVSRIIEKVLSKEPAGRYRTAGQLGRILATYLERTRSQGEEMAGAANTNLPAPTVRPPGSGRRPDQERPTQAAGPLTHEATAPIHLSAPPLSRTDWLAVALGLLALAALLGLIPLWLLVYQRWAALLP